MNRKMLLLLLLLLLLDRPIHAKPPRKPNIIVILVDDLGFSDIAPYGASEIETPNISRLAGEGVRLKEFYNNAICAPTRASLLTGQYQHQAGVGFFNYNLGLPEYQGFLNKESLTLGEVFKNAGYRTLMSGKWHVGDDPDQWPNQRGFDRFFGFIGGASNYYETGDPQNPTVPLVLNNQPYFLKQGTYLTDEITEHALSFISEGQKKEQPFFLYLAYNAPHWPLQTTEKDLSRYKDRYQQGWDSLRVQRARNAKAQGVFDAQQEITQHDDRVQPWDRLTYDEKQYWQKRQEVFAAMIDHVDQGVGKLLQKLKELGADNNTLIVFLSDNGAQGGQGTAIYTRRNTGPVGSAGSYDVQNSNWSQAGNSPLRSYKGSPYEGGISAPFIAWYPQHIPAGKIRKGTVHLIDLAPTLYDFAGISYPNSYHQLKSKPLPGESFKGVLVNGTDQLPRQQPIFWERGGNYAVRKGPWKLVSAVEKDNQIELYNIDSDRAENHNLAANNPQVVNELQGLYKEWAEKNGVIDYNKLKVMPVFSRPAQQSRNR